MGVGGYKFFSLKGGRVCVKGCAFVLYGSRSFVFMDD